MANANTKRKKRKGCYEGEVDLANSSIHNSKTHTKQIKTTGGIVTTQGYAALINKMKTDESKADKPTETKAYEWNHKTGRSGAQQTHAS